MDNLFQLGMIVVFVPVKHEYQLVSVKIIVVGEMGENGKSKISGLKRLLSKYRWIGVMLILLFSSGNDLKGQTADSLVSFIKDFGNFLLYRNHDTNYIRSRGDEVSVRLIAVGKFNYFRIRDRINDTRFRYRPVRDLSVGAGLSYKWFSLDLTFSLGLRKNADLENTRFFDFQGKIFSSKQYIAGTLQYYKGYKLQGLSGTPVVLREGSERREDIRTINIGLQYFYAFNYTRFSLKAPFDLNEIQRRSAGSVIAGAGFSIYVMDADTSVVPPEVAGYFDPLTHIVDMNILSLTLNVGYMYSFVYKERLFLTLGLIPGLSITGGDYLTDERRLTGPHLNLKVSTMNALGYNSNKFYTGIHFIVDGQFTRLEKKRSAEIGHGKAGLFAGYRF